jgi:hypothetical protein
MQFANDKDRLFDLANLMNEQSLTPMMVTDDLLYVIDAALLPEEVEFLLEMGGGRLSRRQVEANVPLPPEDLDRVLNALLDKGQVAELQAEPGCEPSEPTVATSSRRSSTGTSRTWVWNTSTSNRELRS